MWRATWLLLFLAVGCRGQAGGGDDAAPAASAIPRAAPSARGADFPRGQPSASPSTKLSDPFAAGAGGGTVL